MRHEKHKTNTLRIISPEVCGWDWWNWSKITVWVRLLKLF